MLFLAESSENPWLAAVVAGAASIVIVIAALGLRRSPRAGTRDDKLREMVGELESLTSKLESLVCEADKRIEELRRLTGKQATEPSDPLVLSVYELSDSGRSSIQIAKELDEHVGKVELILALRDRSSEL